MTDSLDKRTKAFENKQSRKAETLFKDKVKSVRRLAEWIAGIVGFDAQTTSDYSQNLINDQMVTGGLNKVVDQVTADLNEYGFTDYNAENIRHKLDTYLAQEQARHLKN